MPVPLKSPHVLNEAAQVCHADADDSDYRLTRLSGASEAVSSMASLQ